MFAIPLNLSAFLAPLLLGRGMVQMTAYQVYNVSSSGGGAPDWPLASALSVTLLVLGSLITVATLIVAGRRGSEARK